LDGSRQAHVAGHTHMAKRCHGNEHEIRRRDTYRADRCEEGNRVTPAGAQISSLEAKYVHVWDLEND
jgi:hypothetical protein